MTLTTTIPEAIAPLNSRVNDVTKIFAVAVADSTIETIDDLFHHNKDWEVELIGIEQDLRSEQYALVRRALNELNELIKRHNFRVEKSIRNQRAGLLTGDARPDWLD